MEKSPSDLDLLPDLKLIAAQADALAKAIEGRGLWPGEVSDALQVITGAARRLSDFRWKVRYHR